MADPHRLRSVAIGDDGSLRGRYVHFARQRQHRQVHSDCAAPPPGRSRERAADGDAPAAGDASSTSGRRPDGQIECTFSRASFAAEHVIVAIPFTMLRSVQIDMDLPERKRRAIRELDYGTNAKLMVGFSKRICAQSIARTAARLPISDIN